MRAAVDLPANGVQRTARSTSARGELLLIFQREKGSAPLVRIPSLWAESGPVPRCLYFAIRRGETNSFAQLVFLFLRAWEFRQQWDLASERLQHPAPAFSWVADLIDYSIPLQRAHRPPAFLQA